MSRKNINENIQEEKINTGCNSIGRANNFAIETANEFASLKNLVQNNSIICLTINKMRFFMKNYQAKKAKCENYRYYKTLVSVIALFILCNFNVFSQQSSITITSIDIGNDTITKALFDAQMTAKLEAIGGASNWNGELIIGAGITTIANGASNSTGVFYVRRYTIKSVTLVDVTYIGNYAFYNCSALMSIKLLNSLTTIGNSVFYACTGLTSITLPNSLTTIGEYAFYRCSGLTGLTIPNSVTTIGEYAFYNCRGLTRITLPNNLTTIGNYAFTNCSGLTSITIPDSVTNIGTSAFQGCSGLTNITLPNSVTSISTSTFYGCSGLTSITLPDNLTTIGSSAFYNCSGLTSITLPNSVTTIGEYAFYNCSGLTNITLSNSLTTIGNYAFQNCSELTSITFPNPSSLTSIGNYTFSNCSKLTAIKLPDSLRTIGIYAFRDCSGLTDVTFPDNFTNIRSYAFIGCCNLTTITLPSSLTSIGIQAFSNCSNLKILKFLGVKPPATLETNIFAFDNIDTIWVPPFYGDAYRARFASAGYDNETISKIYERELVLVLNTSPENAGSIITGKNIHEQWIGITMDATPNDCYRFRNWTNASGDIVSENNSFRFDINIYTFSDTALTANFDFNIYNLNVNTNNPNRGSVNGSGTYDCGKNAVLTAYPAEGHMFLNWTDENNHILSTANPYNMPITRDINVRANFDILPNAIFTLIITPSTGGSVTTNPPNTTNIVNGTQVTFTAHPDAGYRFVNWTGENISSTLNPETIVMRTDRTIRANFELLPTTTTATLTISTSNGGSVETNPPNTTNIPIGTEITLTANPNSCYRFKEWSNGSTGSQINLTLTSDMDLTAIFESSEATYNLQVTSNGNGTVTGAENNVPCGATRQIRAMPVSSCYRFTGWSNGSTVNPFELDITSDMNLVASFAIVQYNLSVSAGTGGSVNISGTNPRDCGSTTSLSATADAGYKFLNWTSGGIEISTDNNLDITIASDTSLVANFEVNNDGSISENNLISNAIIYPNPVDKNTTISFGLAASGNMRIVLSDISGQELMEIHNAFTEAGKFTKTFSLEILPSGAYFIKITHNGSTKIQKAIKK